MSEEIRQEETVRDRGSSVQNTPAARRFASMMWTLVAAVVVITLMLLMVGRFHNNATSTVNPQKSDQ